MNACTIVRRASIKNLYYKSLRQLHIRLSIHENTFKFLKHKQQNFLGILFKLSDN